MSDKAVITIEVHGDQIEITLEPDKPETVSGKMAYKMIELAQRDYQRFLSEEAGK